MMMKRILKHLMWNMSKSETVIAFLYRIQRLQLIDYLRNPQLFDDYEITKGKMDDVFLAVTGKTLVGGAEKMSTTFILIKEIQIVFQR